jgi:endonuclease YncB( thermonuclease family)
MPLRLMAAAGITTLALDGGYLQAGTASSLESGLVASVYDGGTLTLRAGAAFASSDRHARARLRRVLLAGNARSVSRRFRETRTSSGWM